MTRALIGHTGFVGSNIARQMRFDAYYNSKNISEIRGREFDLIVCAGMPGTKWLANQNPDADREAIFRLLSELMESSGRVVLISTVDAIKASTPYGRHRLIAEQVLGSYRKTTAIYLSAIFGHGMKKNALFDLIHRYMLENIAINDTYQWYPLRRIGYDIERVTTMEEKKITFASEPIAMEEIRKRFFPDRVIGPYTKDPISYSVEPHPEFALSKAEIFDEMGAYLNA